MRHGTPCPRAASLHERGAVSRAGAITDNPTSTKSRGDPRLLQNNSAPMSSASPPCTNSTAGTDVVNVIHGLCQPSTGHRHRRHLHRVTEQHRTTCQNDAERLAPRPAHIGISAIVKCTPSTGCHARFEPSFRGHADRVARKSACDRERCRPALSLRTLVGFACAQCGTSSREFGPTHMPVPGAGQYSGARRSRHDRHPLCQER